MDSPNISGIVRVLYVIPIVVVIILVSTIVLSIKNRNLRKENNQLKELLKDDYKSKYEQSEQQLRRTQVERDSLRNSLSSSYIRTENYLRSRDSLAKELTKIPKRYNNKNSKELAKLMEERAK